MPPEDTGGLSRRAWQRYWQSDRLAACMPDHPSAAAAIEGHWRQVFSGLSSATRVLDVATGNGVLLVWAARAAGEQGRSLQLTGIDAARIDPQRFVGAEQAVLRDVTFHGGVAAEQLPFGDAAFDCVVSQFGLEYSEFGASLSEVARVLAPRGSLHWLAHGASSAVVAESAARTAQMDYLLAQHGAFDAMGFFANALLQRRRVSKARDRLQACLEHARAYCGENPPAELVQQVHDSFLHMAVEHAHYHPQDIAGLVEENREKMRFYRRRLRDLLAAQLTPERERQVAQLLSGSGWRDVSMSPLTATDTASELGVIISATRAPGD